MYFSLSAIAFAMFHTTEQLKVCRLFNGICPDFLPRPAFEVRNPYLLANNYYRSRLHHQNIKSFDCILVGVFLDLLNEVRNIFTTIICFAEASRIPSRSPAVPAAVHLQKNGNSPRKLSWSDLLHPTRDLYTARSYTFRKWFPLTVIFILWK